MCSLFTKHSNFKVVSWSYLFLIVKKMTFYYIEYPSFSSIHYWMKLHLLLLHVSLIIFFCYSLLYRVSDIHLIFLFQLFQLIKLIIILHIFKTSLRSHTLFLNSKFQILWQLLQISLSLSLIASYIILSIFIVFITSLIIMLFVLINLSFNWFIICTNDTFFLFSGKYWVNFRFLWLYLVLQFYIQWVTLFFMYVAALNSWILN